MKYVIDNIDYEVVIIKKNNKNTYIRVKSDLKIYVTTSYFVSKKQIKYLLDKNILSIKKMINSCKVKNQKESSFYYLGKIYDIIFVSNLDNKIDILDNKIFVIDQKYLDKWLKKQTINIFSERLNNIYNLFEENIPFPKLKIRKMTTRWGVCNRKNKTVTLNSELIKYSINEIDYVIIHELSHFVYFDHSKGFWNEVSKYCPNYKEIRKVLKNG